MKEYTEEQVANVFIEKKSGVQEFIESMSGPTINRRIKENINSLKEITNSLKAVLSGSFANFNDTVEELEGVLDDLKDMKDEIGKK